MNTSQSNTDPPPEYSSYAQTQHGETELFTIVPLTEATAPPLPPTPPPPTPPTPTQCISATVKEKILDVFTVLLIVVMIALGIVVIMSTWNILPKINAKCPNTSDWIIMVTIAVLLQLACLLGVIIQVIRSNKFETGYSTGTIVISCVFFFMSVMSGKIGDTCLYQFEWYEIMAIFLYAPFALVILYGVAITIHSIFK